MKNMKLIIVLAMIVTLLLLGGCKKNQPQQTTTTIPESTTLQQTTTTRQATTQTLSVGSGKVFEKNTKLEQAVVVLETSFDAGRYKAQFISDDFIKLTLYNEAKYAVYTGSGQHSSSKYTTNSGKDCCQRSATFIFDINKGENGKYYFVIEKMSGSATYVNIVVDKMSVFG
jgi:hypothetical protein